MEEAGTVVTLVHGTQQRLHLAEVLSSCEEEQHVTGRLGEQPHSRLPSPKRLQSAPCQDSFRIVPSTPAGMSAPAASPWVTPRSGVQLEGRDGTQQDPDGLGSGPR